MKRVTTNKNNLSSIKNVKNQSVIRSKARFGISAFKDAGLGANNAVHSTALKSNLVTNYGFDNKHEQNLNEKVE